ncbi:NB-ARC domain-containing protein [Dictyobacter arantiisoli]|uniref:NB-ARC domain-containing protein n=1 Tax=Dictyobacter arantiisoli TaxID=2014874 RepID=UPI0011EE39B6|nr:NB-ARC domain-containing protein [Dictyobacter arantiisoli]
MNREPELRLVDEAFQTLLDGDRLLRTPIIEFQGIGGIGKTFLLQKILEHCRAQNIKPLLIDVGKNPDTIGQEIIKQVRTHLPSIDETTDISAINATRMLLREEPVVMLLDAVDTADDRQQKQITAMLRALLDDEKFFVILTSKQLLTFGQERSVARKLTSHSLKAIERKDCNMYVTKLKHQVDPEVRDMVFDWTRGYPRAMNVMAQAIDSGSDPRTPQGKQDILTLLQEKVINEGVLAQSSEEDKQRYHIILQLFSIPRRFNLVLMQDLIENFANEQRRDNTMDYIPLLREINDEADNILHWDMARAGYCIDEPLRFIFLLLVKMERPDWYRTIQEFLAHTNLQLATDIKVPERSFDRVRYVRECFYHTACLPETPEKDALLEQALKIVMQETPEEIMQFATEFAQDEELREELGDHLATLQALIGERL